MQLCWLAALCLSAGADTITNTHTLQETSVEASQTVVRSFITATSPTQSMQTESMQTLGLTEVSEALKLMNGITVKDYGGLGAMKTVSVRNLGATHTGVIYDGVPVSNAQAGQIDIARFGSQTLSEIRMAIGATQDLLAPAATEGYSGVLSLWSKGAAPSTLRSADAQGYEREVSASYGSWNTLSASAFYTLLPGLSAQANYRHTDGNYPFTLSNGDEEIREHRHNGRVDDGTVELNYCDEHWKVKGSGYLNDRRLPGSVVLYNYSTHEHMREGNGLAQAQYQTRLNQRWQLLGRAKYNHAMTHYNDGTASTYATGMVQHVFNYRQNEYYASAGGLGQFQWGDVRANFSGVYDVQHSALHSNLPTAHSIQRTTHFGVLRVQAQYGQHMLQGGVLYTYSREEGHTRQAWSPTLSARVLLWSNGEHQLHARWMSRMAFRLPTFNESYYYVLGNHDLDPEKAREHNAGLAYRGLWGATLLQVTADAYHNRVKDKLIAFPTSFAWKVANLGEAVSQGLECSVQISVPMADYRIEASANYQLQDTRNLDDPSNSKTYKKQLPYVPKNTANGALLFHTPWVNVGYTFQWSDVRYSSTMNTFRYRLPAFSEHSLTATRDWKQLRVQATLQNLTDQQYELIQYYPMPGRQWRISCQYRF